MKPKSKYGFLRVTLFLFFLCLIGQWICGWYEYRQEQKEHGQPTEFKDYAAEMGRGTLENWQSEFLQLCWQVAGLSFLYYVGSPQSKEGDDRKEEILNAILRAVRPEDAEKILKELESKFPKK